MPPAEETLTELELGTSDPAYPFVEGSEAGSCQCLLRELLPRSDGEYLEFFEVRDGPPTALKAAVDERDDATARVVDERDEAGVVVIHVENPRAWLATTLADEGVFLRELRAEDGEGRIVAEVPPSCNPASVLGSVTDEHPRVDLVAKRDRPVEGPLFVREHLRNVVDERLTDRQREVLVAAYLGGYFERPREVTGVQLADRLDIAPATLSQHLRAAQRKVLDAFFEDGFVPSPGDAGVDDDIDPE